MKSRLGRRLRQGGWSMIELMMAVFIGMLVLGGLFSLLYNLIQASGTQSDMTQLQDRERVAMMALQNVVENAGYLPQNYYNSPPATSAGTAPTPSVANALPAVGSYAMTGQYLSGLSGTNASDSIGVRYVSGMASSGADAVTDCVGHTYTASSVDGYPFTTEFYVDSAGTLQCYVQDQATGKNGATYAIVSGLSTSSTTPGLVISYGVDSTLSGSVTQYVPASGMTNLWYNGFGAKVCCNVRSVKFTLNFVNPLYNANHVTTVGQNPTLPVVLIVFLPNSPTTS